MKFSLVTECFCEFPWYFWLAQLQWLKSGSRGGHGRSALPPKRRGGDTVSLR